MKLKGVGTKVWKGTTNKTLIQVAKYTFGINSTTLKGFYFMIDDQRTAGPGRPLRKIGVESQAEIRIMPKGQGGNQHGN